MKTIRYAAKDGQGDDFIYDEQPEWDEVDQMYVGKINPYSFLLSKLVDTDQMTAGDCCKVTITTELQLLEIDNNCDLDKNGNPK